VPYPWTSTAVPACLPWTFRGSLAWLATLLRSARQSELEDEASREVSLGLQLFVLQDLCKQKKLVPVLICGNVKQRWENEADGIQQPVTRHEPHALANNTEEDACMHM
jgi:hypothetical protein